MAPADRQRRISKQLIALRQRCIESAKWAFKDAPTRDAHLLLLGDRQTSLGSQSKRVVSGNSFELRVTNGEGDRMLDYWEKKDTQRPISPYYVNWSGFMTETKRTKEKHLDVREFVLRNLK